MKVVIPRGENCIESLEKLIEFLKANAEDYPMLRTPMNIYFTLKSPKGEVFPLNDYNFILEDNEMRDETRLAVEKAKEACLMNLFAELRRMERVLEEIEDEIEHARKMLKKAEEKGFSTVGSWQDKVENLKQKKEGPCRQQVQLARTLQRCLEARLVDWECCVQRDEKSRIVRVSVRPTIDAKCEVLRAPLYYYPWKFSNEDYDKKMWFYVSNKGY